MRKMKNTKLFLVIVLVLGLLFPQIVLASLLSFRSQNRIEYNSPAGQPAKTRPGFKQGEIIFKTTGKARDEANLLRKYKLTILHRDYRLGYILAGTPQETDITKLIADLRKESAVRYAQPNYIYRPLDIPNDSQYARQWAMKKINAEQGWSVVKPVSGVTIAILDTGVDANHPDLKDKLVPGVNTISPLKSSRDDEGHGTHVAGVAGAVINNGLGTAGVAGLPGIKIMPVKVFDGNGSGSDISISDGIIWAADHGAKVVNMSFGSDYRSDVLNEAIEYAYNKGIVLIAAAGNWASEEISYPAALSKVMAISATDKNGKLAEYSSYGPLIDVCAPGDKIYSTFWNPHKGSTYTEMSGTSMASPMVAGLAALLLAQNPKLTNDEVRQIIEVSATDLGDPGWDPQFGHGQINLYKALTLSLANIDDSNGTMQKAINLKNGIANKEKIDFGSDVDWFKIYVPDQNHLQVEVLPAGKVSPGVEIYNESAELLSSFNAGGSSKKNDKGFGNSGNALKVAEAVYGLVTDLAEGDYYIKVFGNHFRWSEESYTVTAHVIPETGLVKDLNEPNNSWEEAKSLSPGDVVTGAILNGNDEDWFKINLTGQAYRIRVDVPDGLNLAVVIESEDNYKATSNEYMFTDNPANWFYEIIDNGGQGQDEDGVIVLSGNEAGSYYIKLYEISGAAVNDTYTLTVTDYDLRGDCYENNDTWERATQIRFGEEITANFHRQEDQDWYRIQVQDTGILKTGLRKRPDYDLYLFRDPTAEPVGGSRYYDYGQDSNRENSEEQFFEFKVSPGDYYINICNYGRISADTYTMKIEFGTFQFIDQEINDKPSQANEILLEHTKQGTLYPGNDMDFYVLNIEKPQPILLYLTPPTDLDTMVIVLKEMAPDKENKGDKESQDDQEDRGAQADRQDTGHPEPLLEPVMEIDSGNKGKPDTGVFVPGQPGKYYLMVTAFEDKSQSKYSLTVKPFKVTPDKWEDNDSIMKAKILTSGITINPTFMGTEDQDWYKIYVPGRGKLDVHLTVPSDIDGVVEIYDAKGKLLVKVDQSMTGEEETATCPVPKPGYFYIKTYDYLGNSSVQPYMLTVKYWK